MRRCLNPKHPHKNLAVLSSIFTPTGETSQSTSEPSHTPSPPAQQEEQFTCQFCKYLLEDAVLGDCRVTRWIGSGTFGDVYEAQQLPPLNRRVAIKVMAVEHVADERAAELFEREVQAIANLDHANILPVLRVGMIGEGRPYLVMKYAANGSLQKFCSASLPPFSVLPTAVPDPTRKPNQEKANASTASKVVTSDEQHAANSTAVPKASSSAKQDLDDSNTSSDSLLEAETTHLPDAQNELAAEPTLTASVSHAAIILTPQQLLPYLEGAAAALQYAHEHGIIHLDVKPANLLLDSANRILLADFGVSALLEGYTHASLHGYVGTPLYTAPEQWLEQPRAASDQYALAVTCYELLTGHAPFTGNLYSIMHGHIQTPPPPLRRFQPQLSAEVEAVILRALAKEPADRYKDMHAFVQAYRTALACSANSRTDADEQGYATEALLNASELPGDSTSASASTTIITEPAGKGAGKTLSQTASTLDQTAPETLQHRHKQDKSHPRKKNSLRTLLLALVILLLIASSAFGVTWFTNPCVLSKCPAMVLSTHAIQLTNSAAEPVAIHNTGTADLYWSAALDRNAPWLHVLPQEGTVHPAKTASFTISSDATKVLNNLNLFTTNVIVLGQHIPSQNIIVTMQVKTGLSAIDVQATGTDFSLVQGNLQPHSQKITITNRSGTTLSWLASFSENTWLVVTPGQNNALANDKSDVLTVTVNGQNLPPNTYTVKLTLTGSLGSQSLPAVLREFTISLNVSPTAQVGSPTPVTPPTQVTPTPTQPTFSFRSFNAQVAPANNAPTIKRSGQAMVWDARDGLLLVFGGLDNRGNVLNDLWSYNTSDGSWNELSSPSPALPLGTCGIAPAPRMDAAMVWDSVHQQLLLYGGVDASNIYFGDLWSFDPHTKAWTVLQCSGNSPGARSSNAVWDGQHMLLLGGINTSGLLQDFWSYTPGSGWLQLANAAMGPRAYQSMVWDTNDSRLYVFGGLDSNGLQQDDFWMYTISGGWLQITPASTGVGSGRPGARQEAIATWDTKDNLLLLMGGWETGQGTPFYGVWAYDPLQNAWGLVTPLYPNNSQNSGSHIIPGRSASTMVWDTADQHAFP